MNFFRNLLTVTDRVSADVYTYIFLCDFVNFFVLLFGFTAFGVRSNFYILEHIKYHSKWIYGYSLAKAMVE